MSQWSNDYERSQDQIPLWGVGVYHNSQATVVYSLAYRLCILTAVPSSTQPSTLHGMVKWLTVLADS